jgi:hypothetical protein
MRTEADVREVFRLNALGLSISAIAASTDVTTTTIKRWLRRDEESVVGSRGRSAHRHCAQGCNLVRDAPPAPYAFLLGMYLGDGHIVHNHRGVYRLEIACCAGYPRIIDECADAVADVLPSCQVGRRRRAGVVLVGCYSKHLPCLFPQHGPGPKHRRRIALVPWQEDIALGEHPELFVRGLLHSDGWRGTNRVRGANGSRYAYPRYQFSNRSDDIKQLFVRACDRLGVKTRRMNAYNISVARRDSVAILDRFVGPKS